MMTIYEQAIAKFGKEAQLNQLQEECAELIAVINQYRRGKANEADVCSEIADVEIMLSQMWSVFNVELITSSQLSKLEKLRMYLEKAE